MSSLKQNLHLKQTQTLTITNELKQAIELLQMSHTELETLIDELVLENPMLEKVGEASQENSANEADTDAASKDKETYDLECDNVWQTSETSHSNEQFDFISQRATTRKTLRGFIDEQIQLVFSDHEDRFLALCLLDYLMPSGYFEGDLSKISDDLGIEVQKLESILLVLQTLEPTGVFAKDLAGCIRAQLEEQDLLSPEIEHFLEHLNLVNGYDFSKLKKSCRLDDDAFKEILKLIRTCDPKPGAQYDLPLFDHIEPDVLVKKDLEGEWMIETNDKVNHKVKLNEEYVSLLDDLKNKKEKSYVMENKKSANWLVKAIEQRSKTLVMTAAEIVRRQSDFFEKGVSALKPLKLEEVAREIGVHESTVSRITTNKFLYSSRGFFELKYFFSTSLKKAYADDISSKTVQYEIQKLVESEPSQKTYSDDKLVRLLEQKGIVVARRTIAKYRDVLGIPSSVDRKKINFNKG